MGIKIKNPAYHRHNQPWTNQEKQAVVDYWLAEYAVDQIAGLLSRTEQAIRSKVSQIFNHPQDDFEKSLQEQLCTVYTGYDWRSKKWMKKASEYSPELYSKKSNLESYVVNKAFFSKVNLTYHTVESIQKTVSGQVFINRSHRIQDCDFVIEDKDLTENN